MKGLRAVVLSGEGRAFCAGLDLRDATEGDGIGSEASQRDLPITLDLRNAPPTVLFAMDKPVICALNGPAAGYGMDTALGCDIRIAGRGAKMAAAFVKRGVVPESGGTWLLPRLLGWSRAAKLIFTGRTLTATEAKPIAATMTRTVSASGLDWGVLAAAGVLTIVPGALVIYFVRNYIAKGFALGRV